MILYLNHQKTQLYLRQLNGNYLVYYRRLQGLSKNSINQMLYYIQEKQPPKICLPFFLLLTAFHIAQSHD